MMFKVGVSAPVGAKIIVVVDVIAVKVVYKRYRSYTVSIVL